MDFLGAQSSTRSRSRVLVLLFVIALGLMGIGLHLAVSAVAWSFGVIPSMSEPSAPVRAMIALLWASALLGSLFRWMDVRGGGDRLARRLGAEPLAEAARRLPDTPLANVVAEIAIAAATPAPSVHVLTRETSPNAFVLGSARTGHLLVVTRGALETFDRDQLQAVVAHEFGHIVSGDTLVNMRLLIALGGLHALDEIGRLWQTRADERQLHPGVLMGGALRLFASIGVLLGSVLRAAVSRQREFLADARAVQFTRNPAALAGALQAVADSGEGVALHDHRCAELAHLCFASDEAPWWRRALASHPPRDARIRAIDPHFAVRRRVRARRRAARPDPASPTATRQADRAGR